MCSLVSVQNLGMGHTWLVQDWMIDGSKLRKKLKKCQRLSKYVKVNVAKLSPTTVVHDPHHGNLGTLKSSS